MTRGRVSSLRRAPSAARGKVSEIGGYPPRFGGVRPSLGDHSPTLQGLAQRSKCPMNRVLIWPMLEVEEVKRLLCSKRLVRILERSPAMGKRLTQVPVMGSRRSRCDENRSRTVVIHWRSVVRVRGTGNPMALYPKKGSMNATLMAVWVHLTRPSTPPERPVANSIPLSSTVAQRGRDASLDYARRPAFGTTQLAVCFWEGGPTGAGWRRQTDEGLRKVLVFAR